MFFTKNQPLNRQVPSQWVSLLPDAIRFNNGLPVGAFQSMCQYKTALAKCHPKTWSYRSQLPGARPQKKHPVAALPDKGYYPFFNIWWPGKVHHLWLPPTQRRTFRRLPEKPIDTVEKCPFWALNGGICPDGHHAFTWFFPCKLLYFSASFIKEYYCLRGFFYG